MKHNQADLFTKGVPQETLHGLIGYLTGQHPLEELLRIIPKDEGGQSSAPPEDDQDLPNVTERP